MSYNTIYACANDAVFIGRVTACIAQEGNPTPLTIVSDVIWPVASASDIEAAYASGLAAGNPNPGGDEAVITDQMILGQVQAHLPAS